MANKSGITWDSVSFLFFKASCLSFLTSLGEKINILVLYFCYCHSRRFHSVLKLKSLSLKTAREYRLGQRNRAIPLLPFPFQMFWACVCKPVLPKIQLRWVFPSTPVIFYCLNIAGGSLSSPPPSSFSRIHFIGERPFIWFLCVHSIGLCWTMITQHKQCPTSLRSMTHTFPVPS